MTSKRHSILTLALCALLAGPTPARACGPYFPEAIFWFSDRPNVPIERFLDGNLGILDQRLAGTYRFVAYRYLTGLGLDAASRAALSPFFTPAQLHDGDPWGEEATARWLEARRTVADAPRDDWIDVSSRITHRQGEETVDFYYRNCLDDAFDNAARTLAKRKADLGADSPLVVAWAKAQDQVFGTCGGRGAPPEAFGEDATAAARADRAYQIAAATFYLARFDEAEKLFRAIAADADSPWRSIAALMIARTSIRRGVLALPVDAEALRAADAQLAAIESDPSLASVHDSAARLRGYVALQIDPAAARQRLASALLKPTLEANAAQQLIDYLRLARGADARRDGLALWLRGYPCDGCIGAPPLLEAVAVASEAKGVRSTGMPGPDAGAARLTLAYFWARHLAWSESKDANPAQARDVLDRLLAGEAGPLSPGDLNRVLAARAPLSTTLEEYLRLSQLVPVGVKLEDIELVDPAKQAVLLSDDTLLALDAYLSLPLLEQVLVSRQLATPLARRVALFAWMKANLVGDEDAAARLLPSLRELVPEMAADLDAWNGAKGGARRFAFALAALRFPGAQPFPGSAFGRETPIAEIDSFGDNWWCLAAASSGDFPERNRSIDTIEPPAFLSADDLAAATRLREQLAPVEPAAQYLGAIVFEWARTHSDDPRVPEALHRVVKATRYTHCTNDGGETSRRAFDLLHRRYPDNPWTKQTPFWFSG